MMTAALGLLAVATAADAHVAGRASPPCDYGAADRDTFLELARLEPHGRGFRYLA
jgi:hypothetical protein